MWYIFKNNNCIANCDFEPNYEDLASRKEIAIEHEEGLNITNILLLDNTICEKPEEVLTEEELKQQALTVIYNARQKAFNDTQWVFMRQVTGTAEQKLTDEEYQKYVDYWAEWRNFPESCEDVFNPIYPILK